MNKYYVMKQIREPYRLTEALRDGQVIMLHRHKNSGRIVPDFMCRPYPLISDRVKELFEKFIGEGIYTPCVVQEEPEMVFWEFHPRQIPVDYARFTLGGEVEAIHDFGLAPFLRVDGYKQTSVLVSRIVAESLLRRGYNRLELTAVETLASDRKGEPIEDIR